MMTVALLTLLAGAVLDCRADAGASQPRTTVYRTTPDQDFRAVVHPTWGDETGPGSVIIDLDAAVARQTFRGLGGSFAEASCFTLMRLPEGKRAAAFEMLFGKSGLRLSIGRIHCASSDYSMHLYSYDPVAGDRALAHFSIDEDRTWVLPALRAALKANPNLFLYSSPWSAPGWMKENGTMCGSRLRPDMFGVYADYIVRFLKAYRDEGIVISAHTPQNEVETEQSFNSPTMRMTAEDEAKFVLTLRPKLDAAGLPTKIWILDHNYDLTNHVDRVLATPGVRASVAGIAWHSYCGEPEAVRRYRDAFPELENIHTEMGPHIDRSKRTFLWWGDLILRGFNAGQTGFTNWCLALDENGQPNTSCGFPCAGLVAIHSETGEIVPSNQYQAFRHISPFVDVGAKVLEAPRTTALPAGGAAARVRQSVYSVFRNPDGRLVVVINHPGEGGGQFMLRLNGRYLPVVLLGHSLTTVVVDCAFAGAVQSQSDGETGGIREISIVGDGTGMNWTQRCDGKELAWVTSEYRWGTGTLKVDGQAQKWNRPSSSKDGVTVYAPVAGLEVRVRRQTVEDGLEETYEWRNVSDKSLALSEIDVHTPFRDDYIPRGEIWTRRCFAHVWAGGSSAWVCAMRMGGRAPHLGLAVTSGAVDAYEIKLRSLKNGMSNYRGVIALSPPDVTLAPGAATSVSWRLFPFADKPDFFRRVRALGGVSVTASDWTVTRREPVRVTFEWMGGKVTKHVAYEREGRVVVPFEYGNGKRTFAELNAIADPFEHVLRRARFLVAHQQVNEPGSPYDGAFTQYDMETGKQRRWWEVGGAADMEPGAERLGIGVSLAVLAQHGYKDEFLLPLRRYADFISKLCRSDGYVYSSLAPESRKRDFNSPWAAEFFLEMYKLTGEKPYLRKAYDVLLAVVRRKGSLILVESPDADLVKNLKAAGLKAEADTLAAALIHHKEFYFGEAKNERIEEVNFAPEFATSRILQFLAAYDFNGDKRSLADARGFLPVFEANLGPQPSAWCHDIGLHHWDGYWFGKRRCWGDTLPNHWNGTGADAFAELARHDLDRDENLLRSRKIARQVLTLIRPDGGAGCAFVYPDRVNGSPAKFLDPLANDQDWVMLYYLRNGMR